MGTALKSVLLVCLLGSIASAGTVQIAVTPEGDGTVGKDRYGYFSNWEWASFATAANPNSAYHDYADGSGSWRDVYLQVAIGSLTDADAITGASLCINVLGASGSGSSLRHASNSSAATGNASDRIGGDQAVMDLPGTTPLGWMTIDVTDFIKADVENGYNWAAFSFPNKGYSSFSFSSGDDATNAPYLRVVTSGGPIAVPLPAALPAGLGLMGVLGLGRLVRRARAA